MSSSIPPNAANTRSTANNSTTSDSTPRGDDSGFQLKRKDPTSERPKDSKKKDEPEGKGGEAAQKADLINIGSTATGATGATGITAITGIHKIIVEHIDKLMAGKDIVMANLKESKEIPEPLRGGTLSLQQTGTETVIRFDNVKVNEAKLLLDNPQQLQALSDILYQKGLSNVSIQLGNNVVIELPKAAGAPDTPLTTFASGQQSYERDGGGQQGGGQQQKKDQGKNPQD